MTKHGELNSLIVDIDSKATQLKKTSDVGLPTKFNLSVLRGQVVFTSTYTLVNKHGQWIFQIDHHYNRLERSYKVMFESKSLPFTRDEFKNYCSIMIQDNKDRCCGNSYQVKVLLLAGPSELVGQGDQGYANGFGGTLAQVLLIATPMTAKPDWTFDSGLNVMSFSYQREIADAKPTLYLGGIQGHHNLSAINIYYLINLLAGHSYSINKSLAKYHSFSNEDQYSFRLLMHDLKNNLLPLDSYNSSNSLQNHYPKLESAVYELVQKMKTNKSFIEDYRLIEHKELENLLHEVVFTTQGSSQLLLEGSTFAIMGTDENDQIRFIPLINNKENSNEGKVLESTTIKLLKEMTTACGYDYIEKSIDCQSALQFNCLFALSVTRIFSKDSIKAQKIKSIDGQMLPVCSDKSKKIIENVFEKMKEYFDEYTY
jgi:hypothetical protein